MKAKNQRPASKPAPAPQTARRTLWFRIIAIAVPLANLVLLEFILRVAGFGYPTRFFIRSTINNVPVFIENQEFSKRYFPPGLERTPQPVVMPAAKSPNSIRIFILGESAAMGDPEPAFGFGRILEVLLRETLPGKHVEVINVAVTAINSHVIREIAKDCTDKQGDYWLVYMGNNEVVGPFGAGTVFGAQVPGLAAIRANLALKDLRLGQLVDLLRQKLFGKSSTLKTWEGMEMFLKHQVAQSDPRMGRVYAHFESNLRDIIQFGQESGAQVLLSSVPVNLKDCPPFASQHRANLSQPQRAEWEKLFQAGIALEKAGHFSAALTNFQQAWKIDPQFAELAFRMGQALTASSEFAGARVFFDFACEQDTLRFRADTRLNQSIRRLATNSPATRFVDAADLIARHSPQGLPGEDCFYEHVHPNFVGNYLIARAFAEQILSGATNHTPLLTSEECARRLAFTDFNRYQILDEVRQRLQQPPFTQQLDHEARETRLRRQLDSLQRASLTNAFRIYEEAIARTPDDWMLRENFAKLLQDFGESQRAEVQWRRVIQLLPHYEEAQYRLGSNLDTQGRSAESMAYFQQALRLRPGSFEARNGLALALANQGQLVAAVEQYERAIRQKPDFAEARVNLGQTLAQQGKVREALTQYQEALRLDSNSPAVHINLGKLLATQGRTAEAVAHYREALQLKPDHAVAHYNLGNALNVQGDNESAMKHFAEAVRSHPDFIEARYNLGLALAKQGDNAGALSQFSEVVRLKANWPEARFNLGVALGKAKRYEEAAEQFRETLRLQPENAQAKRFLEQAESMGTK